MAANRSTHPVEYAAWLSMKGRCENPRHAAYPQYGGVGITIAPRWRESFAAFLVDVGPRPSTGHSLDRFPNGAGNYEPGNVRWATRAEQIRNRSMTIWLTHEGETLCLTDWARRLGISNVALSKRLATGWPIDLALTAPKGTRLSASAA